MSDNPYKPQHIGDDFGPELETWHLGDEVDLCKYAGDTFVLCSDTDAFPLCKEEMIMLRNILNDLYPTDGRKSE